jgi:hypothetical protein
MAFRAVAESGDMALRLRALIAVLALLLCATAASAGPSAAPTPQTLVVASRDDPHAGRPFVGYVLVLPTSARKGLVSVDARCHGTVLGRTVPGKASRVPERQLIPSVLICTWAIPRDRVGWTFRGRMEVDVQRRHPDGSIELETDEGRITRWIVQP